MKLLSLVLAVLTLLNTIAAWAQKRGIISQAEADLLQRVLSKDKELMADVRKARDRVAADAAAGRLRDDDGHKRR